MPSRVDAIWNGAGEPGAAPRLTPLPAREAGPGGRRFEAYARERLAALPSSTARRDLDRLVVKLCWRLHLELSLTGSDAERAYLLETFARLLTEVETRRMEVEPPELVERVVERVEVPVAPPEEPAGISFVLVDEP